MKFYGDFMHLANLQVNESPKLFNAKTNNNATQLIKF